MQWGGWLIALAFLLALWRVWQRAAHKPPQPKKAFLKQLQSKPIVPARVSRKPLPNYASEKDKRFSQDFAEFGPVVNWWLSDEHVAGAWRLQELPDPDLHIGCSDSPSFGCAYAIFYNQVRVGLLELSAAYGYGQSEPKVHTNIELDYVRLFSFDQVRDFLSHIALHVCNMDETSEHLKTQHAIEQAMTRLVWNTLHISGYTDLDGQDWGELEVSFQGTAMWYLRRRDCEAFRRMKAAA